MFSMYRFIFLYQFDFYAELFIVMFLKMFSMYRFIFSVSIEFYAELFMVMFKESCLVLSIGDGNFINFIAPC